MIDISSINSFNSIAQLLPLITEIYKNQDENRNAWSKRSYKNLKKKKFKKEKIGKF